jgi:transposase InsO family protein
MRTMDLTAQYPKRNLSLANQAHKVYPYLLRDLVIDRPNQVWATDVTYIPMARGFVYLVAIMDWYSRKVLSWRVSNTLDASFCVEALEEALDHGAPEIFNTDQGSQFTSEDFTGVLKREGIQHQHGRQGRWLDNVFVERLWRSVKYEEVYLKPTTASPRRGHHWADTSRSTTPRDDTSRLTGARPTACTTNPLPGWRLPEECTYRAVQFSGVHFFSKGNVEWVPAGNSRNKKRIGWAKFAELMAEHGRDVKIK